MKRILSAFLALMMTLSVLAVTPSLDALAVLGDGDKLSVDISLQVGRYNTSTSVFTPLKVNESINAGDVLTVRICPKNDFLAGATRYVVMYSKSAFEVVGEDKLAFTMNPDNTFRQQVASGYAGATDIKQQYWPQSLVDAGYANDYSAVAVGNQANSSSGNGGYPGYLPGTWLFQFKLKCKRNITASSKARIWMDRKWVKSPTDTSAAAYFTKCEKETDLSSSGSSTLYNFRINLTNTDIKIPLGYPIAPTLKYSPTAPTKTSVTVTVTYPAGSTNKAYKLKSKGTSSPWLSYTKPVVLTANDTVYACYRSPSGTLSSVGSAVVTNIDKTPPVITARTVANNGSTKNSVTVSISDPNYSRKTLTKNGSAMAWPSGNLFRSEGKYVVTAFDKAGNSSKYTFSIDTTAPVITAKTVANKGFSKSSVTVTVSDTNPGTPSATKNGSLISWPSGGVFASDGNYVITGRDKAGNVKYFYFTVDKTPPVVIVKSLTGSAIKNNGSVKGGATIKFSEVNFYQRVITRNGATIPRVITDRYTTPGTYVVTVTDKAFNISVFTFKIT